MILTFECMVDDCSKELEKLQYQHYYYKHGEKPVNVVIRLHGDEIVKLYEQGLGPHRIFEKINEEYITTDIIFSVINEKGIKRSHDEVMRNHNPMYDESVMNNHPKLFSNDTRTSKAGSIGGSKRMEEIFGNDHPNWKGGNIDYDCDWCDKEIGVTRSNYHNHEKHFCSKECKNKYHSERMSGTGNPRYIDGRSIGGFDYGENWTQQRKKIRNRNEKCKDCGKTDNLDVHHKVPIRLFGYYKEQLGNSVHNLVTLCRSCHMKRHGEMDRVKVIENQYQLYKAILNES
jgi:5-methylcytosine-specific restriction endonuclease McrA